MAKQDRRSRRIALFVEGDSERGEARQKTLSAFFHRWLDPQLPEGSKVGIHAIKFQGVSNYLDNLGVAIERQIENLKANFVFGLVDLYGLPPSRFDFSRCTNIWLIRKNLTHSSESTVPVGVLGVSPWIAAFVV